MIVIDADGHVLGRLASYVAKKALLGESIIIVNAEKALISGSRENIIRKQRDKLEIRNIGNYTRGPFHQKRPDKFLRMAVRGMLPFKRPRGKDAYKRVMVYVGIPAEEIKRQHNIDVNAKEAIQRLDELKRKIKKSVTVGEVCHSIGGRF